MTSCRRPTAADRWDTLLGVIAFDGVVVVATLVLVLATVAAAAGLSLGLVAVPGLLPLGWFLSRRWERPAGRQERATAVPHTSVIGAQAR